jgi:glutamyl-tRNA synthetase
MESLKWCGLPYSEGPDIEGPFAPYRQSERKEIYRRYADLLLQSGNAYFAFDTPEALDSLRKQYESEGKIFQYDASTRLKMQNSLALPAGETEKRIMAGEPHVIRFRIPENEEVKATDLIRGEVRFQTAQLDDKVLFKADGLPTYHLANVVDDYLMQITHVIRGEEWLPSLPLHVLLYKAFGWEAVMPEFAHLPLILKPSGQGKLSKRDGDKLGFPVFPLQWKDPENGEISAGYRESGYFSEAVVNMLALLGWNPGTEQELFSLDELAGSFSLDRVGKAGARFDPDKARWFNQQYLKSKTTEELSESILSVLESHGVKGDKVFVARVTELVKERMLFPQDFWEQAWYFFKAPESYDAQMQKKVWKEDTSAALENEVKLFLEQKGLGFGKAAAPLRLLIVGSGMGPHLFDIMEMIGKAETLSRIDKGLTKIR